MTHGPTGSDSCCRFFDDLATRWDDLHPAAEQLPAVHRGLDLCGSLDGATVVDLGCGTGIVTRELLGRIGDGTVIAIDLSAEMIARAARSVESPRVRFVRSDVMSSGLAGNSVDVVLCYNTFPHFQDAAAVAGELTRWLRPGGRMLVWHDTGREIINGIHRRVGGAVAHDTLPPAQDLAALLSRQGLRIDVVEDERDRYTVLAGRRADPHHGTP